MIRRTIAAIIWLFFAFATTLSLSSNQDPHWYDYASAGPLLIVLVALVLGYDKLLFQELDGWLARLQAPTASDHSKNDSSQ